MSRTAVYLALVALLVLHQDFWLWDDATLVLGFLPAGLAYHAAYTLVTAMVWVAAIKYAWPHAIVRITGTAHSPKDSDE